MAKLDLASTLMKSVAPTPPAATKVQPAPIAEEQSAPAHLVALPVDSPDTEAPLEDTPSDSRPDSPQEEKPTTPSRARTAPRVKAPAPKQASDSTEAVTTGMAIELPVDIDQRLAAYIEATRKTHPTVLLDAVESTYEQLPDLIREALGDEPAPKVSLFNRTPMQVSTRRLPRGEEKVRRTVKLTASNRALLDELAVKLGAPSRTFLVVTAYDAYLPKLS